jgi:CheY-like chemotaxis protein
VNSKLGRGSCFSVEVPRAPKSERLVTLSSAVGNRSKPSTREKTILVIENDLQILEGMVELLEARNMKVIPTVSSEEAIEALETMEHIPSLIIADFHLDQGTGLDAIRNLRRTCGSQIPAIMITANHTPTLRYELAQEAIAFLGKPLRPAKLFEAVGELSA